MKRFLFALLGLCALSAQAASFSVRIDASSTSIPTSFAGTNGALSLPSGIYRIDTIMVDNRSTSEVAVNCAGTATSGTPSDSSSRNIYVNGSEAWSLPQQTGYGSRCYIRSMTGGTISSGIVVVTVIGVANS